VWINYARSAHGRKVMKRWSLMGKSGVRGRTRKPALIFNLGADIQIGDMKLPKGSYSIRTLPTEEE
jgi:hypothetical protein